MSTAMVVSNGSKPAQTKIYPPNRTLYVRNLNDKVSKNDLRRALYTIFSAHGTVLGVIALKTKKMRGQAHIAYKDVQTSTQAMNALQDHDCLGKKMAIAYGNGKSHIIARLDGSAKQSDARTLAATSASNSRPAVNAAPSTLSTAPADAGLPKPPTAAAGNGVAEEQGIKRKRDEDEEEDDDEGEEMDVSDDE